MDIYGLAQYTPAIQISHITCILVRQSEILLHRVLIIKLMVLLSVASSAANPKYPNYDIIRMLPPPKQNTAKNTANDQPKIKRESISLFIFFSFSGIINTFPILWAGSSAGQSICLLNISTHSGSFFLPLLKEFFYCIYAFYYY